MTFIYLNFPQLLIWRTYYRVFSRKTRSYTEEQSIRLFKLNAATQRMQTGVLPITQTPTIPNTHVHSHHPTRINISNLSVGRVTDAMQFPTDVALTLQHQIERFNSSRIEIDKEEKEENPTPIFKSSNYFGCNETTSKIPNFTLREFKHLHSRFEEHISSNWNFGRGKNRSSREMTYSLYFSQYFSTEAHETQWEICSISRARRLKSSFQA